MDKRKPHWVVNNSKNYRFHVIMDIECEEKHLDVSFNFDTPLEKHRCGEQDVGSKEMIC